MIVRKFHILRANDFFRSEFRIFARTSGYTAVKNAEFALNEFDLILAQLLHEKRAISVFL